MLKRDHLFFLARCGFDSFDLDPAEDLTASLAALIPSALPTRTRPTSWSTCATDLASEAILAPAARGVRVAHDTSTPDEAGYSDSQRCRYAAPIRAADPYTREAMKESLPIPAELPAENPPTRRCG